MAKIDIALKETLGYEGGYSDIVDDRGGETYMGVARKMHPNWDGWTIVDMYKANPQPNQKLHAQLESDSNLQNKVAVFYKERYWNPIKLDDVRDQDIANEVFDTAVNQGVRTASKYLQRSLNLLNRDQRDYADLKVDGRVGPATIGVLHIALNKGLRWKVGLIKCLNGEQYIRYRAISLFSSKQEKFFHGWLRRVTFKLTRS